MNYFQYRGDDLYAEQVALSELAERFSTPCYVYSRATLERHWRAFDEAFGEVEHLVCYAVKANGNLAVLDLLARLGSGFDIVSVGELERVLRAGGQPDRIVFSGVGKQRHEIERALQVGIGCFNVESEPELALIEQVAREHGKAAPVSIRVNPDVDPGTHPYISTGLRENKFGVAIDQAEALYERMQRADYLAVHGIDCHIGSQVTSLAPYRDAMSRLLGLLDRLGERGIAVSTLNVGGGLGIRYDDESPPAPADLVASVLQCLDGRNLQVRMEPGRAIVGNAGVLLTRVQLIKRNGAKNFAVVDAAMNDLIRPALYDGWHEVVSVHRPDPHVSEALLYDVVGPVCESGDFLARQRMLSLQPGELLAIRSAGAYAFCMSSNYNSRPRACEVMVDGDRAHLIRRRESVEELFAGECVLPS